MIDIEEEYRRQLNAAAKKVSEDIDFEIISQYFVEDGWTRVTIDRFTDNHHAIDIRMWLNENIGPDDYMSRGSKFLFKDPKHATMFILRWGGEL